MCTLLDAVREISFDWKEEKRNIWELMSAAITLGGRWVSTKVEDLLDESSTIELISQ